MCSLFCSDYAIRFLSENSMVVKIIWCFIAFQILLCHTFCFCPYFSRFCEKLVRWRILVGWSVRVLHDIRRLFSTRREIASYGEREEGSRLVLSGLHNATRCPLFRSHGAKPRMYTFVNDTAAWYGYVFVSYCFCNCYNVYGMRVRYTDGDGAREIQNANDRNAEYIKAFNLRDTFKRHYTEREQGNRHRCV